jgi:D-sedoheptulose 7-phosphate isomerase
MLREFFRRYIDDLTGLLGSIDPDAVERVGAVIWQAYCEGRTLFIIGNGGSAATASHFACDLAKGATVPGKRRVRAASLTDNVALMTAIGNDIGYEELFTEQIANLAEKGDVLIAISASGNSPNILHTLRWAKENDLITVAVLGFDGGEAAKIAEHAVVASSCNYGLVEDFHLIFEHALSQWLRQKIETEGVLETG